MHGEGSRVLALRNFGPRLGWVVTPCLGRFTPPGPWEGHPVRIVQEVGWAQGPVALVWRRQNEWHPPGFGPRTVRPVAW